MTRAAAAVALVAAMVSSPSFAGGLLSEQQAYVAAAAILKGDPYGKSSNQVRSNIESAQLISAGFACGARLKVPVWLFHVRVPKAHNPSGGSDIEGVLVINARSGKLVCAGLPFLD
jgi:hypothetical protein